MTLLHKRHCWQPLLSAEVIAGNEDLITEILTCLPAKSLCRFKSVSKQWNSLISHPRFSCLRLPKSASGIHLLISSSTEFPSYRYVHLAGKRTRGEPFRSLTFVDDPMRIKILHSCNGLLLCSSSPCNSLNRNYYIYNPTTKNFVIIPPPNGDAAIYDAFAMNLAFDPCKAIHYKIIFVRCRQVSSGVTWSWNSQIEIYSSETGTWRLWDDPFTCKIKFSQVSQNRVFCNGTIHWLGDAMETWLRFEVDKECLGTVPKPPIQDSRNKRSEDVYFGESRGHLHLICRQSYSTDPFEVFELESDYSKWFVKYHVHVDAINTVTFPGCKPIFTYSILHLVRGEVEEESYMVLNIPGMIVSYNFKEKTLKKICSVFQLSIWFEAHQHIETLIRI